MSTGFGLRRATVADVADLAALDRLCFANPWPAALYRDELVRDFAHVDVAVNDAGRIVGSSSCWYTLGEAHVLRLVTDPSHRRQGLGRDLLSAAVARAQTARCEHVMLEVARSNRAALALYAAAGFVVVGLRPGYYRAPPDDALIMRLPIASPVSAVSVRDVVDS